MTIKFLDSKRIVGLSTSGSGTTVTESSINDVSHFEGTVGTNYIIGEQITGGTLVGKTITSLSFYLYQLSSGSSGTDTTFTFGIWNSLGVLQKEFGSVNRSSFPIGTAFGNAVKFTGTATESGYVLATNDVIGLRTNTNPASAWTVEIGMYDGNSYSDGQRALFVQDSSPSITSARDIPFEAVYDQDLKPISVQDNSILVEKDTGKRYWFDENKVSTSELKAHYNFDSIGGGTTLTNQATTGDGLGSSANGVNTSITLDTTNEKLGTGAYSFNGSSSKVVLGSASDWTFLSDATSNTWSIAWWMIYDDTLASGHTIMSTTDGSTQTDGMFIDNSGSGTLRLIQVDGNNGSWSSAIPDNTSWHHYAITWNAGTVTLYVDGVSKGTQSQTAGSGTPQYGLTLGANNDEYYTELTLDEMGIWKRVLTTSEISALYNSGTGSIVTEAKSATWTGNIADLSGLKAYWKFNESSGDIVNQATSVGSTDGLGTTASNLQIAGATYDQTGIVANNKSLYFDGSDHGQSGTSTSQFNFLHTPNTKWTVNFWLKYGGDTAINGILDTNGGGGTARVGLLINILSDESMEVWMGRGVPLTTVISANSGASFVPSDSVFHFYSIRYDHTLASSNVKISIDNGTPVTANKTSDTPSSADAAFPLNIAEFCNGYGSFLDGNLTEMSIWNRVLTDAEVTTLYNAGRGKAVY